MKLWPYAVFAFLVLTFPRLLLLTAVAVVLIAVWHTLRID